ncbi:MAG: ABC transporter permease [Thermomicrobiales bacterium]|nr:ABC transporter permease [Thermomicrobiales bacterium]
MAGALERRRPLVRRARIWPSLALLAPGFGLLIVLLIIPLAYLFRASFNRYDPILISQPAFTLENYAKFFSSRYLGILGQTLLCGVIVTAVTLVLGFPLAYWVARRLRRGRQAVLGLIVLPFTLNTAVLAFGWATILGQSGLINEALIKIGIVDEPVKLMFTRGAVIVALAQALLPYQILSIMAVIARINPSLEEAAENLGASRLTVFRLVILPLALPGMLAGSTFVFLGTVTAFVTPRIIGGGGVKMLGATIYEQIVQTLNWPFAAALSFILVAVTLAVYLVANRLMHQNYLNPT